MRSAVTLLLAFALVPAGCARDDGRPDAPVAEAMAADRPGSGEAGASGRAGDSPSALPMLAPADPTLADKLAAGWLGESYLALSLGQEVVAVVYGFPDAAGDPAELRIRRVVPGVLHPEGLLPRHPSDALDEPGLYLSVLDPGGKGAYYLAALGHPRSVRAEGIEPGQEEFDGTLHRHVGGAVAARVPYVQGAELVLFDVGKPGAVQHLHFAFTFSEPTPPPGGWRFEVP